MPDRAITSVDTSELVFDLLIDEIPYSIKAKPFLFNDETRYYINVNGGADHVFVWYPEVGRFRAIDDSAGILPAALEDAISEKLYVLRK
jgi:hypothetical protein